MPTTNGWWKKCWPSYRQSHPALEQVVLRIGTILGATVHNQITDLFEKPRLLAIRGATAPSSSFWTRTWWASSCTPFGAARRASINVAGDGALTIHEIAQRLGKTHRCSCPPVAAGRAGLLKPLGLTQYGPEQLDFLRYRPVLAQHPAQGTAFGYTPTLTSAAGV